MFAGSLVAIVSPMRADGAIDFEAWARLLDFHAANATDGIVVGGTTGESATLRDSELRELLLRACEQLHGRVAVIAGAGTSSTASTVERVEWLTIACPPIHSQFLRVSRAFISGVRGGGVPR